MILIVDDQPEVRAHLARVLEKKGYRTASAASAAEAVGHLREGAERFGLAILDLDLGDGRGTEGGLELLQQLRAQHPELPVVVLTGKGTIELAVRALKLGAQDFLEKDLYLADTIGLSLERMQRFLEVVRENRRLRSENRELRQAAELVQELQRLKYRPVGVSRPFVELLERARRLAAIPRPVLIRGERGSGKELVAAVIHGAGPRRTRPLVTVNCAAFSGQLLESELFGHEKGAFTGADRQRLGRLELADGGTLFLDEIGNMAPEFQEKLLRAVEYQEFERVGGSRPIKVDVRVIAATNADLEALMEQGRFRRDLYDRLAFEVLRVPPLRERREDIPLLAEHFAQQFAAECKLGPRRFSPEALALLGRYPWPGNVRELKNAVERLVFSVPDEVIEPHHLPREIREGGSGRPAGALSFTERLAALEREMLEQALAGSGWNQKRAAEALGLSYDQFRHYYKKHGLKRPRAQAGA